MRRRVWCASGSAVGRMAARGRAAGGGRSGVVERRRARSEPAAVLGYSGLAGARHSAIHCEHSAIHCDHSAIHCEHSVTTATPQLMRREPMPLRPVRARRPTRGYVGSTSDATRGDAATTGASTQTHERLRWTHERCDESRGRHDRCDDRRCRHSRCDDTGPRTKTRHAQPTRREPRRARAMRREAMPPQPVRRRAV